MIGGFESRQELGIFLFTTVSRLALGPTQPPIQWIPGGQSGRDVNLTTHLHLVSKSKNAWGYTSTTPIRLYGVVLSYAETTEYTLLRKLRLKYETNFRRRIETNKFTHVGREGMRTADKVWSSNLGDG
jgi:hypothetical protein